VAAVRDDGAGGDERNDHERVSCGGTPAPLSDGSGATPEGGAAGSGTSEASERTGASGTRDETTGDDDGGAGGRGVGHEAGDRKGRRRARGTKSRDARETAQRAAGGAV
jgi:hypothetical protein